MLYKFFLIVLNVPYMWYITASYVPLLQKIKPLLNIKVLNYEYKFTICSGQKLVTVNKTIRLLQNIKIIMNDMLPVAQELKINLSSIYFLSLSLLRCTK